MSETAFTGSTTVGNQAQEHDSARAPRCLIKLYVNGTTYEATVDGLSVELKRNGAFLGNGVIKILTGEESK